MLSVVLYIGAGLVVGCLIGWIIAARKSRATPPTPVAEQHLLDGTTKNETKQPDLDAESDAEPGHASAHDSRLEQIQELQARAEEFKLEFQTQQDLGQYQSVRIEELETDLLRFKRRTTEHLDQLTTELNELWSRAGLKNTVTDLPANPEPEVLANLQRLAEPMKGWLHEAGIGSAEMSYQLGLIDALGKHWKQAAKSFQKAAFDGLVPQGWLALGDCNWQLDRPKKAIASYKKCLEKTRMPTHIYHRTAQVAFSERRFDEAQQILDRILTRKNLSVDVFGLAAATFRELGDNARAVATLEDGLTHHPESVQLIAAMVIPLSRLGDAKKAEKQANRATDLDPESAETPYALGVVHMENNNDDRAMTHPISRTADCRDPWAFSEEAFLMARRRQIVLMDGSGRTQVLYELSPADASAGLECHEPRPLTARRREGTGPVG